MKIALIVLTVVALVSTAGCARSSSGTTYQVGGTITSGTSFAVTVAAQPSNPAQTCVVSNGTGQVTNAAVTSITVSCVGFASTGNMTTARELHTATLLKSGLVLIAGGEDTVGDHLSSAELYDPSKGTFTATVSMNTGHLEHTATHLPNGMVLVESCSSPGETRAAALRRARSCTAPE